MTRSRIRPIRSKPRRGRVVDRAYREFILELPSLVPTHDANCLGCWVTGHHVRRLGEPKSDRRMVPLWACRHMRGFGSETVEHGRAAFEKRFEIDLEAEIARLNRQYAEAA